MYLSEKEYEESVRVYVYVLVVAYRARWNRNGSDGSAVQLLPSEMKYKYLQRVSLGFGGVLLGAN